MSKILLKNALMDLLDETKNIQKISVRSICERAELNRSTFYAHYSEPKELLLEIEDELIDETSAHLEKIGKGEENSAMIYLLSFLSYIRHNDRPFRTLLLSSSDPGFRDRFMQMAMLRLVEYMDLTLDETIEQYVYSYIMNGSFSIITQWIRSGYSVDERKLLQLLFTLNKNTLSNGIVND